MLDVGDAAVRDAALDDHRTVAERQAEFVERVELKGKAGFDERAAAADLPDRHRLEDGDFALELAENFDALGVPLVFRPTHPAATIASISSSTRRPSSR